MTFTTFMLPRILYLVQKYTKKKHIHKQQIKLTLKMTLELKHLIMKYIKNNTFLETDLSAFCEISITKKVNII